MDGENGTGNRQSLAIEICENADGNLLGATNNAVELTVYLMKLYNIPLKNVVQHNYWSGKNCPNRIRKGEPYNWQTFLNKVEQGLKANTQPKTAFYRVRRSWNEAASQLGAFSNLEYAKRACVKGYYVFDENGNVVYPVDSTYKAKVTVDALNVRSGPGTQYKINNCIRDYGVYTIVETQNGWGKLKSGAGWLSLQYTKTV